MKTAIVTDSGCGLSKVEANAKGIFYLPLQVLCDEKEYEFQKVDDNTFIINGSVSIYDLKKILNVDVPEGDYETLSGYLLEILGRVPEDNENPTIETENVIYKIEKYEDKRILWVKACKV